MTCPLHWSHDLSATELAERLTATGLHPNTIADLVRLRFTSGARERIEGELGPLEAHVEAGVMPAEGSKDPALCTCVRWDEASLHVEPKAWPWLPEPPDPPQLPEPPTPDPPEPPPVPEPPAHELADTLEYDEVAWAAELAADMQTADEAEDRKW